MEEVEADEGGEPEPEGAVVVGEKQAEEDEEAGDAADDEFCFHGLLGLANRLDFADAFKDFEDAVGAEAVEDARAAFFGLQDAGVFEEGEVAGDGGHFDADELGDFLDGAFAFGEFLEDEEAGGVGEGLEDGGVGSEPSLDGG